MPIVQRLGKNQMAECLAEAIARQTPVTLTCRQEGRWHTLRTRILSKDERGLWVAHPQCQSPPGPQIREGMEVGLSFKLKHHKHILNAVVEAVGQFGLPDGQQVQALRTSVPQRMQRVQRRAYQRVQVPRNRSVLATFWHGGLAVLESGREPPLTWEGWLTNISAGGFQVRLMTRGAPELEVGDLVGVRIDLGQDYEPLVCDAQFRQQVLDKGGVRLQGFQFLGLNESRRGQNVLRRIGRAVIQFQRYAESHRSSVA